MQESKSRSSDARSVKDNEEEDTAEQRREDGDGCRDGTMEGGGAGSDVGDGGARAKQLSSDKIGPIGEEQVP